MQVIADTGLRGDGLPPESSDLPAVFQRLYYHLYSNSHASRAERINHDLSLLLLLKLSAEEDDETARRVEEFLTSDADEAELVAHLDRLFPELVDGQRAFGIGVSAARQALRYLGQVSLTHAPAHALGEAFQALIGPRLRGDKGQFFTPRSLVRAMVQVIAPGPSESVVDPACGTGGFLLEAHVYQSGRGAVSGSLVGVDKDRDLARLAGAVLEVGTRGRAAIRSFDSLDLAEWDDPSLPRSVDVVLTNPPFGSRIGVTNSDILSRFDFGHVWRAVEHGNWECTDRLATSQDPQILFIERCVQLLRPGGRMGIVLPEGVFGNRQQGYVWTWLRQRGEIIGLLDCPRTTFQPGTDTKTNVLFFRRYKAEPPADRRDRAKVAVALNAGHDRRGRVRRADGSAYPDDFAALGDDYHRSVSDLWHSVDLTDASYLVPRYHAPESGPDQEEVALTQGARWASLGDLVREGVLRIRKGHEVGAEAYGTGPIPFVRTSDISNFEIRADPSKGVSEEIWERVAPLQELAPGDVLLVVDGRYRIGAAALLTEANRRCVVQSHIRVLSVDPERLDPFALLFALGLPSVRLRIRKLVFVQSTIGTLGPRLKELRVPLLSGDGPWTAKVDAFRSVLQRRDALLHELQGVSGPDYEL